MSDEQIMERIRRMIDEEHRLRGSGEPDRAARVKELEEQLDVCWDLLRQRRAARDAGEGEHAEHILARPVDEVENYRQ
ncbi:DUF2630 family protein [Actinocorallia populi]|uniref:DUF2630 family protein n=1 Tax=Actinocorallia populi TaxID=2079200 RepID=UPI000D08D3EE|nr:DUF2630 family protein [Actinocorallia populi]